MYTYTYIYIYAGRRVRLIHAKVELHSWDSIHKRKSV